MEVESCDFKPDCSRSTMSLGRAGLAAPAERKPCPVNHWRRSRVFAAHRDHHTGILLRQAGRAGEDLLVEIGGDCT